MSLFTPEAVARFEDVMRKDPNSQVFAPLADAYRAEGRLPDAEKLSADGVRRHPNFAGGWVVRGKVLRELKRLKEAEEALRKASLLAPENLLALQLLGEVCLEQKNPKESLKVFKRALFINPLAEKAKRIVSKLESLTADEYGEDLFSMTKLTPLQESEPAKKPTPAEAPKPGEPPKGLVRMLSLIDAFIVRNDIVRADQLVDETRVEFGDHPEIEQRQKLLQRRKASQLSSSSEVAQPLTPVTSREDTIRERKIETLRSLLRNIERARDASLTS